MARKRKPRLPRSPLPRKTGGAHKSAKDYDRRKWKAAPRDEER